MTEHDEHELFDTGVVPTQGAWTASQIAGVIVGGSLLALTLTLLAVGMVIGSQPL